MKSPFKLLSLTVRALAASILLALLFMPVAQASSSWAPTYTSPGPGQSGSSPCGGTANSLYVFNRGGSGYCVSEGESQCYVTARVNGVIVSASNYQVKWRKSLQSSGCMSTVYDGRIMDVTPGDCFTFTLYWVNTPAAGSFIEFDIYFDTF